jgi:hypothetical protein
VSHKDYTQTIKRLIKEGLIVGRAPSGGQHVKLILADGSVYLAGASVSDWRAARNMETAIRRTCRK